jgi:hypothetical protein
VRRNVRLLVFLQGTTLMHAGGLGRTPEERVAQVRAGEDPTLHDYPGYVPIGEAAAKLERWREQGAQIDYLSSHRDPDDLAKDGGVLQTYAFPRGRLLSRAPGQTYGDVAARELPDLLVEDDCRSIGAEQLAHAQLPPELRARVKSIVVPEFGGIDHLPDSLQALLDFEPE